MEYSEILTLIAQKLSDGSTFSFGNIPIGKKVRVEGKFYQIVSYSEREAPEAPIEELLFHGSSAEKTIESGANAIGLSIFKAYAEFPLEITLNFPAGTETDVSSSVYSLSLVMAVSDSDKVKELSELLASGDKLTLYNKIKEFQQSDSFWDYPRISCVPGNYEISGTSVKITDTVSLPVSITDKNSGEELAMVPIISGFTLAGKYFVSGSLPKITPVKGQTTSTSFAVQKLGIIDTAIVVYTHTESGYNYYPIESPSSQVNSLNVQSISDTNLNFVFDENGNAYFVYYEEQGTGADTSSANHWIIIRHPTDGSAGCYFYIPTGSIETSSDSLKLVADLKNNVLYAYTLNEMTMKLYKFPSIFDYSSSDTSTYSSVTLGTDDVESFEINFDSPQEFYHNRIAINGGVLYDLGSVTESSESKSMLVIYDFENADSDSLTRAVSDKTVDLSASLTELGASRASQITDMLYQDGAVYMLLKDSSDGDSRGAVIKYDTVFETISTLGWSNEDVVSDTDKFYVYYYSSTNETTEHIYDSYDAESATLGNKVISTVGLAGFKPSVYAPSDASSAFYGPSKFIAIKPRRLVISDEGIAVYTNDDGALSYKNVNRIVTVDLESFAIAETSDASVSFGTDSTNLIYQGTGTACNAFTGIEGSVYISNGSSWNATADEGTFTLGIPCSDDGE